MIFIGKAQKGIKCSLKKKLCFIKLLQICFLKKYIFKIVFLKILFLNTLSKLLSRKIHFKNYFLKKKTFSKFFSQKNISQIALSKKDIFKIALSKDIFKFTLSKIHFHNLEISKISKNINLTALIQSILHQNHQKNFPNCH